VKRLEYERGTMVEAGDRSLVSVAGVQEYKTVSIKKKYL
jgi:hypothetical protein